MTPPVKTGRLVWRTVVVLALTVLAILLPFVATSPDIYQPAYAMIGAVLTAAFGIGF